MINVSKFGNYDYDSSRWVWDNLYNPIYRKGWGEALTEEFEVIASPNFIAAKDDNEILIRGDVVFNFDGGNGEPYINQKVIEKEMLIKFNAMRYSVLNFSFIPRYGSLQKVKQGGKRGDRLDVYMYYLDEFYKNDDTRILNYTKDKDGLKKYLKKIGSVNEYFKKFYLIEDDNFLSDLIECGRQFGKEDRVENKKRYLNLALRFWRIRENAFRKNGIDVKALDDGELLICQLPESM